MPHRLRLTFLSALGVLLLLAHPFPATADTCLSPSPFQQRTTELTQDQRQGLVQLFRALAGDWQGNSDTFFCASAGNPADVETGHETVRARIEVDRQDNLYLTADFYAPSERTSFTKTVSFNLGSDHLSVGTRNAALTEISQDRAAFFYREHRAATPTSPTRIRDFFYTLELSEKHLRLTEKIYVQGKLSSGCTWRFSRP